MLKSFAVLLTLINYQPTFSYSLAFLEKENIELALKEYFGNEITEIEYIKFRDTRYWGGESRRNGFCPRFVIKGKAKIKFIVNNEKRCTVIAKENNDSIYRYKVKLKKIRCQLVNNPTEAQ